jgi:nucleotide-binding universal stress UspA family protein
VFKVIVWATDGSQAAEDALSVARGLAEQDGASLVVVHVDEVAHSRLGSYDARADEGTTEDALRRRTEELGESGIAASFATPRRGEGGTASAIADCARTVGADLIVAGTRGHGPVAGLVAGSVAQRLLHVAPCPLLIVPAAHGASG